MLPKVSSSVIFLFICIFATCDDLGEREICSRFVQHKVTDEQKVKRGETSGYLNSMCDQDPLLLENIVTGDETWSYKFNPESKRQSMAWCSPTSHPPKKSRLQKSKAKTQLIAFFDNKGIIHKEFVPIDQTTNAAFYQAVLIRLLQRIRRVRSEFHRIGKWTLLYDNVPIHLRSTTRGPPTALGRVLCVPGRIFDCS